MAAVKAGKKAKAPTKNPDTKSSVLKKMQDEKGFQKKLKRVKDAGVGTPDGFTTQEGKDKALERVYKEFYRSLPKNLSKRLQKAKDAQRKNNPYRPPEARKAGGKMKSKGLKRGGKVDDTMEKILKGMSAKERKAFLESMGFATKDAEGVSRSYRKAGGKMKSKGYKAGGKMKKKPQSGHNRLY